MKLTSMKTCVHLFCALACLLPMEICLGGVLCSNQDSQVDLGHAIGQECCGNTPVSRESFLSFECPATEYSRNECLDCSDSPFCFGCDWGLILPNRTKPITFTTFTYMHADFHAVTNDAVLASEELPAQSPGIANGALPLLRTVILLT